MLHRAGNVDGEGDGCGLTVDIPREIWAEEVRRGGHAPSLALDPRFAVAHVFIPRGAGDVAAVKERARETMSRIGLRVLAERDDVVVTTALGPQAREEEPRLLAGRRADRGRARLLRADRPARGGARRARGLLLAPTRSSTRCSAPPSALGRLLPRPARRPRQDRGAARPQPLLHEHLARLQARAAVRRARPQRRDQHGRAPAPGGADARRAAAARRLRLAGPQRAPSRR